MLLAQTPAIAQAILRRTHAWDLQACAIAAGLVPLSARARVAVAAGETSPAEVHRVLGTRHRTSDSG
jgi:hypothetical protein